MINKRNTHISEKENVRIKPRERQKLNWDDKLTLEFNGDAPQLSELIIEKVNNVPTVFLCGNSTVVDQDNEPWASWGQMIPRFFNDSICFANYAESGESANTFIGAGRLKKALTQMKPGDYIFMEFGHNDQKQKGPGKGAYYSFMTSLKTFIDEARARGAYPVLVTPTQRRSFDENGKIRDTHEDYPEAMRWLAAKENVPLIDLNEMTRTLYEAMGVEPSKKAFVHYPAGTYPGQNLSLTICAATIPVTILHIRMLWTVSNGMTARLQKLKSRTAINLKVGTNEQQNIIINPIIYLRYPLYQCPIPPRIPMGRRDGNS